MVAKIGEHAGKKQGQNAEISDQKALLTILHQGKVLKKLKLDTFLHPEGSIQPTINQRLSINNYNDRMKFSKVAWLLCAWLLTYNNA